MKIIESIKNLSKGELFLWISSLLIIIISFLIFQNTNYLNLITSLIGVTSLIFLAKGDAIGQVLMIIFSLVYGYISIVFKYYGEAITYIGMTLPISILSLYIWLKNPFSKHEVKVEDVSIKKIIILLIISIGVTFIFYNILKALDTKNIIISTISITTSFIAASLQAIRSRYYAVIYALNDIVLIVLWSMALKEDLGYMSLVICFIIFLINDIYGFINWTRIKNKQKLI
jgi:nicotinamide mononucleotide transporter PnuC